MINSMTGFAAGRRATELGLLTVELRSLNHRYAEMMLRLPEELRSVEPRLREMISDRVRRGKVDLSVRFRAGAGGTVGDLRFNRSLAERLSTLADEAAEVFPAARAPDLAAWLAWPGVVEESEADLGPLHEALIELVDSALVELLAYRGREGEKLAAVIRERLAEVRKIAGEVRSWLPEIREKQREKLEEKIALITDAPVDPERLEQEVAFLLQRLDVDEELDRLDAHVGEVDRTLNSDKAVGRRLDFLMQELNRETNTLGSKSVDTRLSQASVELKVLVEQMREQVQNVE